MISFQNNEVLTRINRKLENLSPKFETNPKFQKPKQQILKHFTNISQERNFNSPIQVGKGGWIPAFTSMGDKVFLESKT
jgi:hypothetical protein